MAKSEVGSAEVAGVRITHPDRVLFPDLGLTKLDLARHYQAVGGRLLPHLRDRPLSLVRCPSGRGGQCFYQKHLGKEFPKTIRRVRIQEKEGGSGAYGVANSLAAVVALVQMGVMEIHTWGSRRDRLERPDRMIFDLDPDEGLPWARVIEAARELRDRLGELGLRSFLKTTGGKGLHVVVPLLRRNGWEEVHDFSAAVAEDFVRRRPDRYVATASKEKREGRLFIDYLRNTRGATAVAPYSTRAKPGAPVSTPIAWDELTPDLHSDHFTVANLPARLAALDRDPWDGLAAVRQSITREMKREVGQ
jgi:bifunctional non-homologous end joining protein LigD